MVLPVVLSLALLVWSVVTNLVIGETGYVARNLAAVVVLLVVARQAGLSARDLGLHRATVPSGVRWGALAVGVVALVLVAGVLLQDVIGPLGGLLDDERARMGSSTLVSTALVRIPFGTALFEEAAFRGVLLASFARVTSTRDAVLWTSAVFGIWHVPPTLVALEVNGVPAASTAGLLAIAGGVAVTAIGGLLFALLRTRSGSLVAPILAHWATNSLGLVAAWVSG